MIVVSPSNDSENLSKEISLSFEGENLSKEISPFLLLHCDWQWFDKWEKTLKAFTTCKF